MLLTFLQYDGTFENLWVSRPEMNIPAQLSGCLSWWKHETSNLYFTVTVHCHSAAGQPQSFEAICRTKVKFKIFECPTYRG